MYALAKPYPDIPEPFRLTTERLDALKNADPVADYEQAKKAAVESAQKSFCCDARSTAKL